ncbi:D-alanyl-D-alanine carboxypeptidase [Candidatus Microgenomates bacterium]|nr:D-alanyl-D-alanine carboxypeptidase [Candidatus Microgenomates bacterium]
MFKKSYKYYIFILLIFTAGITTLTAYSFGQKNYIPSDSFLNKKSLSWSRYFAPPKKNISIPQITGKEALAIDAFSYIILDRETLSPLLEKNTDQKLFIASLTKIMTATVALEQIKTGEIVTINNDYANVSPGKMGLFIGEKIKVEDLLNGVLISSANDAALALADFVEEQTNNSFVSLMNQKAKELGMLQTNFSNVIGLDNAENYSTVKDLAYLANFAEKNDFIAEVVKMPEKTVYSIDGKTTHTLTTTNQLLKDGELNILGLKTGSTPGAGECLITLTEKDGHEIITVILGSSDRFTDTKKLIQWVWGNIEWK